MGNQVGSTVVFLLMLDFCLSTKSRPTDTKLSSETLLLDRHCFTHTSRHSGNYVTLAMFTINSHNDELWWIRVMSDIQIYLETSEPISIRPLRFLELRQYRPGKFHHKSVGVVLAR